ncbi:hypothetical protein PGT21_013118 [Puccinia graminis f. sp. tritici]|uniref:Uncharacterized protein n=1 Tax=Puccinia graminis f. sp. tritici TaxID=56615 RepID=A0A5B0LZ54_PUCGR|nr:hypothetical protein PGT21_013118 [Puccinia graminis f. sp. tritici]
MHYSFQDYPSSEQFPANLNSVSPNILPDDRSTQQSTPAPTQTMAKIFECAILFTLICPSKNKRGQTSWVAIRQPKGLKVKFNTRDVDDWDAFRHLIAEKCAIAYEAMYQLLEDSP